MAKMTFTGWQQTQQAATTTGLQNTLTVSYPTYGTSPYWNNQQPWVYLQTTPYLTSTTSTMNYQSYLPIDYGLAEGDVVFFKGDPSVRQYYDDQYQLKVLPDEPYRIKKAWTRTQGIDVDFVIETIDGEEVEHFHPNGAYLKKSDFLTAVDRAKREGKKELDKCDTEVVQS